MRRWLVALLLWAGVARAETTLDIPGWLSRPGVRAVAVEFYATWCKPCMEAMPRWKALEAYRRDEISRGKLRGLVAMVGLSTRDLGRLLDEAGLAEVGGAAS